MTCLLVLNLLSALCAVETFLYVQVTVALSFSVRAVSALWLKSLDVNLLMMLSRSRRRVGADLSAKVSSEKQRTVHRELKTFLFLATI